MKKVITDIINVLCKSVHQKREIEITEVTIDDSQHNKSLGARILEEIRKYGRKYPFRNGINVE